MSHDRANTANDEESRPAESLWSPFPGLRPFQSDESEYFYGRDVEVDQVMVRLRERRFVAVIGGSGSGKSSLVLAGAIPRLRTYAIKEAGDFWAPIVATPGTNHVQGDSPIWRLARKFCGELQETAAGGPSLEDCVALLRREDGLGELVSTYGKKLRGVDKRLLEQLQINFLFLLDQFEELFHPSNSREPVADDCQHLVDRIVEQFKNPHSQVCVALTMRSEHLNDCPRYAELPDAINAASYLVKRLDKKQLREAIEQPVLRYLRQHLAEQREAKRRTRSERLVSVDAPPKLERIPIDDELIRRLLDDSEVILGQQDHADQLPLLQHVLFWVWHEATLRCRQKPLIDGLTMADLRLAVGKRPSDDQVVPEIDASTNALEACLQNRCDEIFSSSTDAQPRWQAVFRSLAFKEPNTGTYTQQRASMLELCEQLEIAPPDDEALAANLEPWLRPHRYLHFDVASRTVKVAHETLIRRWPSFRRWIDEDDRKFHVYVRLLEDCERWIEAGRSDSALSEGHALRRYEDEQLLSILRNETRAARINRLFGMYSDAQNLASVAPDAATFLDRSIQLRAKREKERELEEERTRRASELIELNIAKAAELGARAEAERLRKVVLLLVALALAPLTVILVIWAFTESNVSLRERTVLNSLIGASEIQSQFQPQAQSFNGPQEALRSSLASSFLLNRGLKKPTRWSEGPIIHTIYAPRLDTLTYYERLSEARNISALRKLLQGGVWPGDQRGAAARELPSCKTHRFGAGGTEETTGGGVTAFKYAIRSGKRGLVLGVGQAGEPTLSVATIEDGACIIEQTFISFPQPAGLRVGIAEDAATVVIAYKDFTQFYGVQWDTPSVYAQLRTTVSSPLPGDFAGGLLAERRGAFWSDLQLGTTAVRVFDLEPSAIDDNTARGARALTSVASTNGLCHAFAQGAGFNPPEVTSEWWGLRLKDGTEYCIRISGSRNADQAFYNATLYRDLEAAKDEGNLPLVSALPLGASKPEGFSINVDEGWLAYRAGSSWRAFPWSLKSLEAMARDVFHPEQSAKVQDARGCIFEEYCLEDEKFGSLLKNPID